MAGIYFRTNCVAVRFLNYVAPTALTRHLTASIDLDPSQRSDPAPRLNTTYGSSQGLSAVVILVLRDGSYAFPSDNPAGYGSDLLAQDINWYPLAVFFVAPVGPTVAAWGLFIGRAHLVNGSFDVAADQRAIRAHFGFVTPVQ